MNKNDIYILSVFAQYNKINELQSFSVASLLEKIDGKYSHTKIRSVIKKFLEKEYLNVGFSQGNAKTYFINQKGIDFLDSFNIKEDEELC